MERVTRPEIRGGPPPVAMYDLIRSALRSRPHGVVIGEARGAEAWELIRAAATGHGHSAFTIHATSAEHVWPRFLQVVQAHPDVVRMSEIQIAQSFAEAVTAAIYAIPPVILAGSWTEACVSKAVEQLAFT